MPTPTQLAALQSFHTAALAAAEVTVPWPLQITREQYAQAAACEAVNETGWGEHTPLNSNNVLGIQAIGAYQGSRVAAKGSENTSAGIVTTPHNWRVYGSAAECFADQLRILSTQRNAGGLTYQAALTAPTVPSYIVAECAKWSTNPQKGSDVLATWNAHKAEFLTNG